MKKAGGFGNSLAFSYFCTKNTPMKRQIPVYAVVLAITLLLMSCSQRQPQHVFTDEVRLPMTPVKNQGESELCWAYAMLATIETEHLQMGDSVNLSAVYIGRKLRDYQQSRGYNGDSQRAMGQTLLNMLPTIGIMDYDVLSDDAPDDLPTPQWVFMLGARYSPQEFAHSICAPDEYVGLTCWPDSPYYKKVEVPIPDNWEHNRLLNVPLDTLRQRVDHALRNGHPVCWESRGHAMAIMGLARDERGKPYYLMKNSWGPDGPHGGIIYMSRRKMWKDMVALYMTRAAFDR